MQLIREGRLRWELEWACDTCGNWHDAGWGPAPDAVRTPLLAEHGTYRILLEGPERPSGKILKAFRDAFGSSVKQAQEDAKELRHRGYQGTLVEVTLIAELLTESGVSTAIQKDGSTGT
ncbi:hypothetical protein ACFZDI_12030 [Streptomyces sp. NPDC007907]|uniref:hypothetical protein n=1 Tax=Streptomyces sp. NPDC007907 TaxID=3364789 RepID=UPI0036F0D33F